MIYIFLTIGLLRWGGGFIDGDGSFSTNKHVPRFKLENHVKELELFRRIKEYFNSGNLLIVPPRKNRLNHNSMVVLEINNIHVLKNLILPFLSKNNSKLSLSLALCSRFLFFFFPCEAVLSFFSHQMVIPLPPLLLFIKKKKNLVFIINNYIYIYILFIL